MARFKIFTDDSLSYAINNVDSFDDTLRKNPSSNEWLDDFFKEHKTQSTPYDFDIELKHDPKEPGQYDFDNAKMIYKTFESEKIGKAIIYNNKFMPAFALRYGYKYYLSHLLRSKEKIKSLMRTLFFVGDARRSMARNIVDRLYLLTCLSIDNRLEDRFEYTKYVLAHAGLRRMVFYTYLDNDIARLTFIKAVIRYEKESGFSLSIKKVNRALTHLSCLTNVSAVSIISEDEVEEYLYSFIKEIEK